MRITVLEVQIKRKSVSSIQYVLWFLLDWLCCRCSAFLSVLKMGKKNVYTLCQKYHGRTNRRRDQFTTQQFLISYFIFISTSLQRRKIGKGFARFQFQSSTFSNNVKLAKEDGARKETLFIIDISVSATRCLVVSSHTFLNLDKPIVDNDSLYVKWWGSWTQNNTFVFSFWISLMWFGGMQVSEWLEWRIITQCKNNRWD